MNVPVIINLNTRKYLYYIRPLGKLKLTVVVGYTTVITAIFKVLLWLHVSGFPCAHLAQGGGHPLGTHTIHRKP